MEGWGLRGRWALLGAVFLSACGRAPAPPAARTRPGPTPTVQRTSIGEMPEIDIDAVLAHTKELASDRFEGRAPGTNGEALTVTYLVQAFRQMGVRPGNPNGTYVQNVPLVGLTASGSPLTLDKGKERRQLSWGDDVIAWTRRVTPTSELEHADMVFVGYGIVAPEFDWDDYKGLDVRNKTLVMLVGDPPVPDPRDPSALDPKTFGGRAMTYYGRWTYKFEIAAEKGAAGVLIVHETEPAGYPFDVIKNTNLAERFDLASPDENIERPAVEGWISNDAARGMLSWSGHDFDQLKTLAATREFKPVPLDVTATMTIANTIRSVESSNVVARIEGRDPQRKNELVIYSAHWDHLGVGPIVEGDKIYNGARDNAIGVAGLLEIARGFTKLPPPPRRSILFLAVTAEEQGLLGSAYYAQHPLYPLEETVAAVNIDGLNVQGRTRDLTLIGYGASDLDDYARDAAGEQGRVVGPDREPERGMTFRSDHFSFVRQGVPALTIGDGFEYIGKSPEFSQAVRHDWLTRDYHKPSDSVKPRWDLRGAREDLKVLFAIGYRVADAEARPAWKPGQGPNAKGGPRPPK
jgi:Zn-dependent M28 family amino/carboxypeptidase